VPRRHTGPSSETPQLRRFEVRPVACTAIAMTWIKFALAASVFFFLALSLKAQDKFAGVWKGERQGKTYVIVTLKGGAQPSGTIKIGDINLDQNGEIVEVEREAETEYEILEPRIVDGKLLFQSKESDGDTTRYEMTVTDEKDASLKILEAPGPVKPFKLTKS
jgi:hypothetical protein